MKSLILHAMCCFLLAVATSPRLTAQSKPDAGKPAPAKDKSGEKKDPATQKDPKSKTNALMKIVDWTPGPDQTVHLPTGTAVVTTRAATFRFSYPGGTNYDIAFIAFKHAATNVAYLGPVFPKFALVEDSFFGFTTTSDEAGSITLGTTAYLSAKVEASQTIEQICALYDELSQIEMWGDLYQIIDLRGMFGLNFFAEEQGAALFLPLATLKDITTNGVELTLKYEGYAPTETAEIVLGGSSSQIGILRASVKGKAVPVIFATSMASAH